MHVGKMSKLINKIDLRYTLIKETINNKQYAYLYDDVDYCKSPYIFV